MENLKLLREGKKLSQQQLGEILCISQQSIHKYETQNVEPDIAMLKTMANFFETSIDFLVGNTDIRHKIEPVESFDLNKVEAKLIDKFRNLSTEAKNSIFIIIDILLGIKK